MDAEDVLAYPVSVCRPEVNCGGRGAGWVCGVREAFCRRIEPKIDVVQEGVRGPLGCPSGGGSSGSGWAVLQEGFRRCADFVHGTPQAGSSLDMPGGGALVAVVRRLGGREAREVVFFFRRFRLFRYFLRLDRDLLLLPT